MSESPIRVGYILKMFPRLSETFILNELLELERQGAEPNVFSLMHPADGRFHGALSELRLTATYRPAQKPEAYWEAIHRLPVQQRTPVGEWSEAMEFLRRYSVPRDLEFLLRAVSIAAEVKRRGIQHLHAHFATIATRMAAVVSMLTGVPYSFTAHAKDIFRTTVNRELLAELVDRSAFCVTVSDFNREFMLANLPGAAPKKIRRLYNGIDLRAFVPEPQSQRREIPHIVSVGRLVPKKGFDHLLRALARCKRRGFEFHATIAGDGEDRGRLHDLIGELDLHGEVKLAGALAHEQVRSLMREATMVALACVPDEDGNMDALPTVLLEALALDLPIVSTRLTGIPEIVSDETGVLCAPGDEDELSRAIEQVWRAIVQGRRRNGAGRERAERLFDLSANVAQLHDRFRRSARREAAA